jgi:hypothetical protein
MTVTATNTMRLTDRKHVEIDVFEKTLACLSVSWPKDMEKFAKSGCYGDFIFDFSALSHLLSAFAQDIWRLHFDQQS